MRLDADNNIIWLHGQAGSEKSTILNTLADHLHQLHRQDAFLFRDRNKADNSEAQRDPCTRIPGDLL